MGKYKYKLKELEVGDIDVNKGITTQVKSVDPETRSAEWEVKYNEDMGIIIIKLYDAMITAQELSYQYPEDDYFQKIADHLKVLRNGYRTHIRKEYPREYNELKRRKEYLKEDEIDEESSSDGAGAYNTPFAFNKNKKADGAPLKYYYRLGFKKVPTKVKGSGLEVKKLWNEENSNDFETKYGGIDLDLIDLPIDIQYSEEYELGLEYENDKHPRWEPNSDRIDKIVINNIKKDKRYYSKLISSNDWGNWK